MYKFKIGDFEFSIWLEVQLKVLEILNGGCRCLKDEELFFMKDIMKNYICSSYLKYIDLNNITQIEVIEGKMYGQYNFKVTSPKEKYNYNRRFTIKDLINYPSFNVPLKIESFPAVELLQEYSNLEAVPCSVGCYFIIIDDKIEYIGQSKNVYNRLQEHWRMWLKNLIFKNIKFKIYNILNNYSDQLKYVESLYINYYKPKENKRKEEMIPRGLYVKDDNMFVNLNYIFNKYDKDTIHRVRVSDEMIPEIF